MSIFVRPDSPPPRQPSPDIVHTPLPSPHVRARDRAATPARLSNQPKSRITSLLVPPGLTPPKTLSQARSYDHLSDKENIRRLTAALEQRTLQRRTRSNFEPSPPTTPQSLPAPSPNRSPNHLHHRRTLSVAIPYRSPPSSSTLTSPVPPVPPIPVTAFSSPMYKTSTCSHTVPITPIYLPDLHELSPVSESASEQKRSFRFAAPPALGKQRSMGMTCIKFFTTRNSSSRILRTGTSAP